MTSSHLEQYIRMQALTEQLGTESEKFMSAFVDLQDQVLATGALSTCLPPRRTRLQRL